MWDKALLPHIHTNPYCDARFLQNEKALSFSQTIRRSGAVSSDLEETYKKETRKTVHQMVIKESVRVLLSKHERSSCLFMGFLLRQVIKSGRILSL
jgi:hypothetical protein